MDSLGRDEKRLGIKFTESSKEKLFEVTGGHPGLLKNAAELAARGQIEPKGDLTTLADALLLHEPVGEVCRELWNDMPEFHRTLQWLAPDVPSERASAVLETLDSGQVKALEQAGILTECTDSSAAIFSPIFRQYIRKQTEQVVYVMVEKFNEVRVESWRGSRSFGVSKAAHRLLAEMARAPDRIHARAQLARGVYDDTPEISLEALDAHIKRLRKPLYSALRQVTQDDSIKAILPAPQGYRLNRKSRGGWVISYQVNT
jgi:hypothetical protein